MSTASAASARASPNLTLAPPTTGVWSSLERVTESIRLAGRVRDRSRREVATAMTPPAVSQSVASDRLSQDIIWVRASEASQAFETEPSQEAATSDLIPDQVEVVERPSSGQQPSSAAGSRSVGPSEEPETVPLIYDGMDDACVICMNDFHHNEMVCRLVCRHMFHAECWERNVAAQETHVSCPICRGAGTLLSAWRYIDLETITQVGPNGQSAELVGITSRMLCHKHPTDGDRRCGEQ